MANHDYKVGQLVKVDVPNTYGIIVKVLEKPFIYGERSKSETNTYNKGLVIKYMKPIETLGESRGVKESTYPFEHPVFGKTFKAVNPKKEVEMLEEELKRLKVLNDVGLGSKDTDFEARKRNLEAIIDYLKSHI